MGAVCEAFEGVWIPLGRCGALSQVRAGVQTA